MATPTFEQLLDGVLTDYRNQFSGQYDTSKGSLTFIKSACLASAVWGIYKHQEQIAAQIFPDTADEQNLEHHTWVRGLSRKVGESAGDYLDRLLSLLRQPPAGGNQHDFVRWAMEVANVKKAWALPLAQGPGSIDVVILADAALTGSEIPTQTLLDAVKTYIDGLRPVRSNLFRVLAPEVLTQAVTMTGVGSALAASVQADISAYMAALSPGQVLYQAHLQALAINAGVENPVLALPGGTVTPTAYQMIRPGVINVS